MSHNTSGKSGIQKGQNYRPINRTNSANKKHNANQPLKQKQEATLAAARHIERGVKLRGERGHCTLKDAETGKVHVMHVGAFFRVVVVEGGNCGMCMNVKENQIIATPPDRGRDGNEGFFTFRLQ